MNQNTRKVILSGMRPTGKLHIGHLEGVLRNWVKLQEDHQCNYFVADYHAITTDTDTRHLRADSIDMVKDWIAFGVNPEKSNIFVQSYVPQHPELHLVFSMLVNLGRLERLPTFIDYLREIVKVDDKDVKQFNEAKRANVNYGFLGYPVLQAADILMYKTDFVPVGEDQIPHVELTKEIARRFNGLYGETFVIPEAKLSNAPRILGTDGRKMSKSYGNVISPMDTKEELEKKIMPMKTDTDRKRLTDPGDPEKCPVYDLHYVYSGDKSLADIAKACRGASIGCRECKSTLPKIISEMYGEYREKRSLLTDEQVIEVMKEGSSRAREIAARTMKEVREVMLMDYLGGAYGSEA